MIVAIIPARYASSRLEGKPLMKIGEMTMIQMVYAQASKVFEAVYVATDDERIRTEVERFGGNVVMTSPEHTSGTDRVAEAASLLPFVPEVVVNVQGDEPLIAPESLEMLIELFSDKQCSIATLVQEMTPDDDPQNPNVVKAAVGQSGYAIYFSRAAIPYPREGAGKFLKHIGLYGYRYKTLMQLCALPPSPLEEIEKLEQLRWIENGYGVKTARSPFPCYGVDTLEDLQKVRVLVENR